MDVLGIAALTGLVWGGIASLLGANILLAAAIGILVFFVALLAMGLCAAASG
jgi:hypothetical protein